MWKLFSEHPREAGQSYGEHMGFAASVGFRLVLAGLAALAHAVFPFVLKTTASRMTREVYETIFLRQGDETTDGGPGG